MTETDADLTKEVDRTDSQTELRADGWAEEVLTGKKRDYGISFGYRDNPFQQYDSINIPHDKLRRSTLVTGATGHGVDTTVTNALYQVADEGDGMFFMDMKGDSAENLLKTLPEHRMDDVVLLGDWDDQTKSINYLDAPTNPTSVNLHELAGTLLTEDDYVGPAIAGVFTEVIREFVEAPEQLTMEDVYTVLSDGEGSDQILEDHDLSRTESYLSDVSPSEEDLKPLLNRLRPLANNDEVANMVSDSNPDVRLKEEIENDSIILFRPSFTSGHHQLVAQAVFQNFWMSVQGIGIADDFWFVNNRIASLVERTNKFPEFYATARSLGLKSLIASHNLTNLPTETQSTLIGNTENGIAFNPTDVQEANKLASAVQGYGREDFLNLEQFTAIARVEGKYGASEGVIKAFAPIEEKRDLEEVNFD